MCLCPNPNALQRCLQRVWSGLARVQTQTFSFLSRSLTHVRVHTCTRASMHVRLLNRNTQHAVSWTWSLGFGWREAQFSTPVFRAVIRGLFGFQAASGSHTCAVRCTERPLMNSVHPAAFVGQQRKSQWQWKALNDL